MVSPNLLPLASTSSSTSATEMWHQRTSVNLKPALGSNRCPIRGLSTPLQSELNCRPHLKETRNVRKARVTLIIFSAHTFALQQIMSKTAGIFMQYKKIPKFFDRKADVFGSFGKVHHCSRETLFADLPLIDFLFYCACMGSGLQTLHL